MYSCHSGICGRSFAFSSDHKGRVSVTTTAAPLWQHGLWSAAGYAPERAARPHERLLLRVRPRRRVPASGRGEHRALHGRSARQPGCCSQQQAPRRGERGGCLPSTPRPARPAAAAERPAPRRGHAAGAGPSAQRSEGGLGWRGYERGARLRSVHELDTERARSPSLSCGTPCTALDSTRRARQTSLLRDAVTCFRSSSQI